MQRLNFPIAEQSFDYNSSSPPNAAVEHSFGWRLQNSSELAFASATLVVYDSL